MITERVEIVMQLLRYIESPRIRDMIVTYINTLIPEYYMVPASINHHRRYPGGLIDHCLEVNEIASATATALGISFNNDELIMASLLHDTRKVFQYSQKQKTPAWVRSGHDGFPMLDFRDRFKTELPKQVEKLIETHMGAWSKIRNPETEMEIVFHFADNLSAQRNIGRKEP